MREWRDETYDACRLGRAVKLFRSILRDVGLRNMAVVLEARGLRSADASRHGDVVVLDFFAERRHMVIDVFVTTVYRTTAII